MSSNKVFGKESRNVGLMDVPTAASVDAAKSADAATVVSWLLESTTSQPAAATESFYLKYTREHAKRIESLINGEGSTLKIMLREEDTDVSGNLCAHI